LFRYKLCHDGGGRSDASHFGITIEVFKTSLLQSGVNDKIVNTLPSVRLLVEYEIYNELNELINTGKTTLVFVNKETRRPCQPPESFMKNVRQYFS
jgi:hypothetical protein